MPEIRVDIDDALLSAASGLDARHQISAAEGWIIATANASNATFVHKDPEFDALPDRVAMMILPHKRTR